MSFRLREIIKDPDKRAVISWLGGGAVLVAVVTFVVEHREATGNNARIVIRLSRQGIASGRDTNIVGPTEEQIEQIQKPVVDELAALTKMLVEKIPTAGRGAEQAVSAAVASIAQGAASDARLQKTLNLLKEDKIADATKLLRAVAVDNPALAGQQTARAENDRKDAALAYRNLGAIAGLTELAFPKRALEAYERAIVLDPDDSESLYWAGAFHSDYGNLVQAQTRLERALELAQAGHQAWCKYCALNGLGDIKRLRGDLRGALDSYRDGLAIAERLAKSDPGNAEWQRNLSVSYENIGGVQMTQGDLAGALKSYQDDRAIAERLAKAAPDNLYYDLEVRNERIGDVQMAQGDLAGALKSYEDAPPIAERHAKSDPCNAGWQRDLSVAYQRIGDVQRAKGDLSAARQSYSDSLAIVDRLARADPGDAFWQRDLAMSFGKLGLVNRQFGDNTKALDAFRQGQAIMARLTKLSPDNARWKKDLAWIDRVIAELAPLPLEHGRNPRNPLSRR